MALDDSLLVHEGKHALQNSGLEKVAAIRNGEKDIQKNAEVNG